MCLASHPMIDQGLQIPESHEAILDFGRLDDHNYDAGLSGPQSWIAIAAPHKGQEIADGLNEIIGQPQSTVAKSILSTASQ